LQKPNVAIVGAGIVGLAHAWSAAERGAKVTIFERTSRACGASIRNFGMVWPIGQTAGTHYEIALTSRKRWLRLETEAGLWVNPCGSIHLAHQPDEWVVLQEFAKHAPGLNVACRLLNPEQVHQHTTAANPNGLLGGLFSPTELCVNPAEATRALPAWLARTFSADIRFNTTVSSVETLSDAPARVCLRTSAGDEFHFDHVIVCGGADLQTLFPEILSKSGIRICKLQMMSIRGYETGWKLGPHLASGLTLRHYQNFQICPGLKRLTQRIADETPELDHFGIHVMASQNNHGEIVLGDSHEYDEDIEPFDKSLIDRLILRELQKIICLPDWTISRHWHGQYGKHPSLPAFEYSPSPGIHLFTATGGSGMTMSFGLAERFWNQRVSS
jgi:FAD dependent oxidoreductase TIGR03364